jgi:hypothetical protein
MSLAISPLSSFPRTRESRLAAISLVESLDSRVRGNDGFWGDETSPSQVPTLLPASQDALVVRRAFEARKGSHLGVKAFLLLQTAPIALRALPQQVGEGLGAISFPNLLGECPEGGKGAFDA